MCSMICRTVTSPTSVWTASRRHVFLGDAIQVCRHLRAGRIHHGEVEFEVPLGIAERVEVVHHVGAHQQRALEPDRALHAVGQELLGIGRVAHDLLHAHLLGDRVGEQLLCREALDRCAQQRGTLA